MPPGLPSFFARPPSLPSPIPGFSLARGREGAPGENPFLPLDPPQQSHPGRPEEAPPPVPSPTTFPGRSRQSAAAEMMGRGVPTPPPPLPPLWAKPRPLSAPREETLYRPSRLKSSPAFPCQDFRVPETLTSGFLPLWRGPSLTEAGPRAAQASSCQTRGQQKDHVPISEGGRGCRGNKEPGCCRVQSPPPF